LSKEITALKVSCYLNLALCYSKRGKWNYVILETDKILEIDSLEQKDRVKALFRRGTAYMEEKDLDRALKDFEMAYKLDQGKDGGVTKSYMELKKKLQEKRDAERKAYAKLFSS
jgi:peptidyl-prolyl isomerase D